MEQKLAEAEAKISQQEDALYKMELDVANANYEIRLLSQEIRNMCNAFLEQISELKKENAALRKQLSEN